MIFRLAYKCILISALVAGLQVGAQDTGSTRLRLGESETAARRSGVYFVNFMNSEYVSRDRDYFRDDAKGSDQSFSLGLKKDLQKKSFGARIDGRDDYSATEQWNYVKVFEANGHYQISELSRLTLGRKKIAWNEWESDWHQGIFQPRYLTNKWRSEDAGLTGLFYEQSTQPIAVTLGFLPVHLPDFGAHFYAVDNRFVSRNPWFNPPASKFEYREAISDLRYSLDKPTLSEGAAHMGGVGKVEFNGAQNYFGRVSAAYKPMPQFLLGFPSRNRVVIAPDDVYMNIEVQPRLAYHTLISHDSVVRAGDWTLRGSVTFERPDRELAPEDYTAQHVTPATITALSVERPLEEDGPYAARIKAAFMKVNGGDADDRGDLASDDSLFEPRYQFFEAYSVALSKPWRVGTVPVETEIRLLYDRPQNGGVASFTAGASFTRQFRAFVEADFLGLLEGPAEISDGFLSLYRANDRVALGVGYVY